MQQVTNEKIQEWRRKAKLGELTREELREAITVLREDRLACGAASAKSKAAKGKKAPVDSDDLLKELEGL